MSIGLLIILIILQQALLLKVHTITLCNFVVPTCSFWQENLFQETGVVIYFLLILFTQFIVDKMKKKKRSVSR